MSDEKLYVIPAGSLEKIREELLELKTTSSCLLKYYAELREVDAWDDSPIIHLCELYCGSSSMDGLLTTLSEDPGVEVPQQYLDMIADGDVVISNAEYVAILTLLESLRNLKSSTATNYGISFEVH